MHGTYISTPGSSKIHLQESLFLQARRQGTESGFRYPDRDCLLSGLFTPRQIASVGKGAGDKARNAILDSGT